MELLSGFKIGILLFQRPRVCIHGNFDVEMGTRPYYGGERSLPLGENESDRTA